MTQKTTDGPIDLTLVIPAYNESKKIPLTITRTITYLNSIPYTWELILVDDGSTDGTVEAAKSVAGQNLKILTNPTNRGKGYTVKTGILQARGRYVGFMDADYKTDITCLADALEQLEAGWPIVIGSRKLQGAQIQVPPQLYRRIGSSVFKNCIHLLFPALRKFQDTQCGFKFFRYEVAQAIFSRLVVDRFMFDVELLHLAYCLNHDICEIPVRWSSDPDTRTTILACIRHNIPDLFRIKKAHKPEP